MLASAANGLDTPLGTTTAPRACPAGTVLDASDGQCAYHVGLIFPYGEFLSKAVRVVGAYLAIEHINSRNATVVPDAAVLPPGFKVMGPLTSADAVEGRLIPPTSLCMQRPRPPAQGRESRVCLLPRADCNSCNVRV